MASAEDILNAVNASNGKLDQLHTDVTAGTNATNSVRTAVVDLRTHLDAGFTVLSQGQAVLAALLGQTATVLEHISQQDDTIICELDKIARTTCELLNEAAIQTRTQLQMRDSLSDLAFMYATANPASALELQRAKEAATRMDQCCPPEQPAPPCRYEECDRPERLRPSKIDVETPDYPYQGKEADQPR
jgi:hypothetical protein